MRSWIGVWFSLLGVLSGCGDAPSTMDAGAGDSSVMLDGGGNDTSMNEDAGCLGADADGDGVPDACDVCALGADQLDADIDGVPDACDQCPGFSDQLDGDSDGVPNSCDVCLTGDDELDGDGDGIPTACDACDSGPNGADADTDGVPDACDVCAASDDALDADADGTPNGCDICGGFDDTVDSDADGVPEGCDVCAGHDDGMDGDTDGTPDGCDCEPTLPEIHPAALETCDGIDNDCTGGADDGLSACPVGCTAGQVDWDLDGASCESAGRVIFVNGAATGNDDGTSWAHAYADLEDAILDAEQAPAGRKQIWIAQGTYSPSREPDDSTDPGERSFVVPAATALGGFEGSEFAATFVRARGEDRFGPDVRSLDVRLDGLSIDVEWGIGLQVEGGEVLASRLIFLGSINIWAGGHAVRGLVSWLRLVGVQASRLLRALRDPRLPPFWRDDHPRRHGDAAQLLGGGEPRL
ncbi:MAG: putative metal-binding motif-containing protein [Sandaracinaceae bacterium]|nr:putative metal-binding motif-containing protein [Sandaracinaceae bacterium]